MLVNKRILSKRKNDKPFYPTKMKADEFFNPYTGKQEDVMISTGPYRKAIAGETTEEVRTYLAHIIEKYNDDKKAYMNKRKLEMEKKIEIRNEDSK